jgi:hypothetical protein
MKTMQKAKSGSKAETLFCKPSTHNANEWSNEKGLANFARPFKVL